MRVRNAIKAVLFCLITIVLYLHIYQIFSWKDTAGPYRSSIDNFYKLDDDIVDVLFFGSSHCYCSVNPAIIWEEHGIASYNLAISGQDFAGSYYGIKEALKTQKPKLICLEMYGSAFSGYGVKGNLYRNLLGYKPSWDLWNATGDLAEEEEKQSLFWKWPIIHTRYTELTEKDFKADYLSRTFMGYESLYHSEDIGEIPIYQVTESSPIEYEEEWLRKIISLAEESGVELFFFHVPYLADEQSQKRCQYVKEIADENNIPFVDMIALQEELGLDTKKDFTDWAHTNEYGATKITEYLGNYLAGNYELEDRRGNEQYALWDENRNCWRRQQRNHDLQMVADLGCYLDTLACIQDYTVILSAEGEYLGESVAYLPERLAEIGIEENFFKSECVWVVKDGSVQYESPKEDCFRHMSIGESDLLIHANDGQLHTIIDRTEYDKVTQGINIVVYDNVLGMVVDAVGFQASENYACVR